MPFRARPFRITRPGRAAAAAGGGAPAAGTGTPPRPKEINYITPSGFRKMTDELTFLRTKMRPEAVGALADAAAEGDRSENAEYIYRKRQLRQIDSRLRFLSKRLDDVQVVDPMAQTRIERVFFGATVPVDDAAAIVNVHHQRGGRLLQGRELTGQHRLLHEVARAVAEPLPNQRR